MTCGADTTAPTVHGDEPGGGGDGVAVTANVTGTFSEAMNAATLTTTTVTLVPQGSTTPVAAAVTYDGATKIVTLDPTANLATSTLYTATIKGGAAGAKDLAGNPLAADKVWTFTTAATGATVLSERSDVDVDDQRLGAGREGPEQRRGGRDRWRDDHAQRGDLRQGPRRACGLRHPVRAQRRVQRR